MRVEVKINTAKGYDTRYVFPVSIHAVPVTNSNGLDGAIQNFEIPKHGMNPPHKPGNYFSYHLQGEGLYAGEQNFYGNLMGWWISDQLDETDKRLATVKVYQDDSTNPASIDAEDLNTLTPDHLVDIGYNEQDPVHLALYGNKGNDVLRGSYNPDELHGGRGADTMKGGASEDQYWVDNKGDKVSEIPRVGDNDKVTTTINYTLGRYVENLAGSGNHGLKLTGNGQTNVIVGTSHGDTIKGLGGADSIDGALGNDVVNGGAGKDTMFASSGKDSLTGGTGEDTFFFFGPGSTVGGVDRVMDFKPADDTVMLFRLGFPSIAQYNFTGPLPDVFFHASKNGQAADPNDYITYDTNDGKLYYDSDGNGSALRVLIATFAHDPKLAAADFFIA